MKGEGRNPIVYRPEIFDVADLASAKAIILTPELGTTTEERWKKETPYLVEQIGIYLQPNENTCILDYGCGIGRLAKALIETYSCWIVGVDISAKMRQLALGYVDSPRFSVCSPEALEMVIAKGFSVDHAISIWVIQHCLRPQEDIARIKAAMKRGGLGYIVNSRFRVVPTDKGWANDGIDVMEMLQREFVEVGQYALPEGITTPQIAQIAFVSVLKKS
mgnify:FL=1